MVTSQIKDYVDFIYFWIKNIFVFTVWENAAWADNQELEKKVTITVITVLKTF